MNARQAEERAMVAAAPPVDCALAARFHAQDTCQALSAAWNVPVPTVHLDRPLGRPWPVGRHAEYHDGSIWIPDPNDALDIVVAHELAHHLVALGASPDRVNGHDEAFYDLRDVLLGAIETRWQNSPRRVQFASATDQFA